MVILLLLRWQSPQGLCSLRAFELSLVKLKLAKLKLAKLKLGGIGKLKQIG